MAIQNFGSTKIVKIFHEKKIKGPHDSLPYVFTLKDVSHSSLVFHSKIHGFYPLIFSPLLPFSTR